MTRDRTEQLAVLLNLIGDEAASAAMVGMDPSKTEQLNQVLKEYESDPPSASEIYSVVEDFERFFLFALEQLQDEMQSSGDSENLDNDGEELDFENDLPEQKPFPKPEFTGDSVRDLNLLHPYQVANAICNDHAVAIAVVIGSLSDAHAAKTMELLPADVRLDVFLEMAEPTEVSDKVKQQILDAAVKSAAQIEHRVIEEDRVEQLVSLIRSLPKKIRGSLIEKLTEQNQELADEVRSEMYRFEDLLRMEDRHVQKILAQSDSDALVCALTGASDELCDKVFSNVSKRAKQTIEEEMQFKTGVKTEEIEAAVRKIVDVIAQLDEAGEIDLE